MPTDPYSGMIPDPEYRTVDITSELVKYWFSDPQNTYFFLSNTRSHTDIKAQTLNGLAFCNLILPKLAYAISIKFSGIHLTKARPHFCVF